MDKEIARIISLRCGLGLNYISKEDRITRLLEQLAEIFPDEVILKGGTALNRVYLQKGKVNRFSEDIDLDYISQDSLDARIRHIRQAMKNLSGFKIDIGRLMHRTLRFNCGYINETGHKDLVRVEFYLSHTRAISTAPILEKLANSSFIASEPVFFRTYAFEDLLARKIVALYNRMEGKDIYDVFYAIDIDYNHKSFTKALRQMMKFYRIEMETREFFEQLKEKLRRASKNSIYIRDSTNHYIPSGLRPDWSIFIDTLIGKLAGCAD